VLTGLAGTRRGRIKSIAQQFETAECAGIRARKVRVARRGLALVRTALAFERDNARHSDQAAGAEGVSNCVNFIRTIRTWCTTRIRLKIWIQMARIMRRTLCGITSAAQSMRRVLPASEMSDEDAAFLAQARKEGNKRGE